VKDSQGLLLELGEVEPAMPDIEQDHAAALRPGKTVLTLQFAPNGGSTAVPVAHSCGMDCPRALMELG